jgi:uncharacterized membrane protein
MVFRAVADARAAAERADRGELAQGERLTSGEIAVSLAPWFWGSVERAADQAFVRLGVGRTREHNGVLVFVCPRRRRFVVLGDSAIHAKVGQTFWDDTAAAIAERFRTGDLTGGIVHGIAVIGDRLAVHFPRGRKTDNELGDDPAGSG